MKINDILNKTKQELKKRELFIQNKKILDNLDIEKIFSTSFQGVYKNSINFVNTERKFFIINPYLNEGEKSISQKELNLNSVNISNIDINKIFLSFIGSLIIYYHNLYTSFSKNSRFKEFVNNKEKDGIYIKEINLYGGQNKSDYIEPNNSEMYFLYGQKYMELGVGVNNKELKTETKIVIAVKKDFIIKNIDRISKKLILIMGSADILTKMLKSKDIEEIYKTLNDFIGTSAIDEYNGYTKEIEKVTYLKSRIYDIYVTPSISTILKEGNIFAKKVSEYIDTDYKK